MNDLEHQQYMDLYNDMVDRIIYKEIIIERMTKYISRNAEKTKSMCVNKKNIKTCNYKECEKCIRNYFERKKVIL